MFVVPCRVKHSKHNQCVGCDNKENAIRKPFRQDATNFRTLPKARKGFGPAKSMPDRLLDVGKEFHPESMLADCIPDCSVNDVSFGFRGYY